MSFLHKTTHVLIILLNTKLRLIKLKLCLSIILTFFYAPLSMTHKISQTPPYNEAGESAQTLKLLKNRFQIHFCLSQISMANRFTLLDSIYTPSKKPLFRKSIKNLDLTYLHLITKKELLDYILTVRVDKLFLKRNSPYFPSKVADVLMHIIEADVCLDPPLRVGLSSRMESIVKKVLDRFKILPCNEQIPFALKFLQLADREGIINRDLTLSFWFTMPIELTFPFLEVLNDSSQNELVQLLINLQKNEILSDEHQAVLAPIIKKISK